jgi:hypothetical protein
MGELITGINFGGKKDRPSRDILLEDSAFREKLENLKEADSSLASAKRLAAEALREQDAILRANADRGVDIDAVGRQVMRNYGIAEVFFDSPEVMSDIHNIAFGPDPEDSPTAA